MTTRALLAASTLFLCLACLPTPPAMLQGDPDGGGPCDAGQAVDAGQADAGVDVAEDAGSEVLEDPWHADSADPGAPLPRSPWQGQSALLVDVSSLDPTLVRRAVESIALFAAQVRGLDSWAGAEVESKALFLYRPDLSTPAYVEFKLTRAGRNAGYITLSTGPSDAPIVELRGDGPTPSERLFEAAGAQGVARVVRLDGEHRVAEDAAGNAIAASRPWVLIGAVSPAGAAELVTTEDLTAWPRGREGWVAATAELRRVRADSLMPTWALERLRNDERSRLDVSAFSRAPRVMVSSFGDVTVLPNGDRLECENNWASAPVFTPLNELTPLWSQQKNFAHATQPDGTLCASGCGATAYAIILGWMDRQASVPNGSAWALPGLRRATFRYRTRVALPPLYQGYTSILVREPASLMWTWPGDSMSEFGPGTSEAMDMRRFLTEISADIGTYCHGTGGATTWGAMGQFERFILRHRLPVRFHSGNNPFGEPGFRDDVIDTLRTSGAPGVIGIWGFEGHYVVVNAHAQCVRRSQSTGQVVWRGDPYLYLNMGWGGEANHWEAIGNLQMSSSFRPVPYVFLRGVFANKLLGPADNADGAKLVQTDVTTPTGLDLATLLYQVVPQPTGTFALVNRGLCVTADASYEGATVSHRPCTVSATQFWRAISNLADNTFQLQSASTGRCLEVTGTSTGSVPMRLATCSSLAAQKLDL